MPLYLAGAPLLEAFPVVPLIGNETLSVGVLSYAGQLNLTAVADGDACPDVEVFAQGARSALDNLAGPRLTAAFKSGRPRLWQPLWQERHDRHRRQIAAAARHQVPTARPGHDDPAACRSTSPAVSAMPRPDTPRVTPATLVTCAISVACSTAQTK